MYNPIKYINSILWNNVKFKVKKNPAYCQKCFTEQGNHSLDLEIHAKVEITNNKIVKLCFLFLLLVSIFSLVCSFLMVQKVHMELLHMQDRMLILNNRIINMYKAFDNIQEIVNKEAQCKQGRVLFTQNSNEENQVGLKQNILSPTHKRVRRENRRRKQAGQGRGNSSGILAVHFKGSFPEMHIRNEGLIGPWYPDNNYTKQYGFSKFHLTEEGSVDVLEAALYLIYAQVYYVSSSPLNSYSIYIRSQGSPAKVMIARCSAIGPNTSHVAEISCFTSAVHYLKINDRIFLQQTENNRTIILRDGHSYLGLIRLNNMRNRS